LEDYREFPFLEKDFAVWMDQLEGNLCAQPGWARLLIYKGVSLYDSAYAPMYWEMLQACRNAFASPPISPASTSAGQHRIANIFTRLQKKDLSLVEGFKIAWQRARESSVMSLPARPLPKFPDGKNALIVRAFLNQSAFPVMPALRNAGWNMLFASWNKKLENPVKELGIRYMDIKAHYRRKYWDVLRKNQHQTEIALKDIDTHLPARLLSQMSGYSFGWDAQVLFMENIAQAKTYVDVYMDMLERLQPEIVILFNENSLPDRAMANVARMKGIPSIAIQHGLFIGYVYRSLATDKMLVWGDEPRKFWLQQGCVPERVISIGALAHEKWQPLKKQATSVLHIKPCILFLGQNPAAFISHETHRKTVDAVFRVIRALPEYDFVVKPHPGEDIKPYQTAYDGLPSKFNVELLNGGKVEDAILESNLVITVFSTAGLEAMLLGKPVIVLNLSQEPSIAPYISAAELVESAELLPQAIRGIMEEPLRCQSLISAGRQYAEEYFGKIDGQAVTRAVQEIEKFVQVGV